MKNQISEEIKTPNINQQFFTPIQNTQQIFDAAENISQEQNTSIITTLATALQSPQISQSPLVKSQVEQVLEQIIEGTSPVQQPLSPEMNQQKIKTPGKVKTPMKKSYVGEQGQVEFTEEILKSNVLQVQSSKVEVKKENPIPLTQTEQICKETIDYNNIIDRILKPQCIDPQHCQAIYQNYDLKFTCGVESTCPYCIKRHQNEIQTLKFLQEIFEDKNISVLTSLNFYALEEQDLFYQIQTFMIQRKYEIIQEFQCSSADQTEFLIQYLLQQDYQYLQKQRIEDQNILSQKFKIGGKNKKTIFTPILLTLIFTYIFNLPLYLSISVIRKLSGTQNLKDIKLNMSQITQFYWNYIENQSSEQRIENCMKYISENSTLFHSIEVIFEDIINFNPGLDFLRDSNEYLQLYNEFIKSRLLYLCNGTQCQNITIRQLRRINWKQILFQISTCQNVNDEPQIFSYTSFYVCYCLFYQLDQNKQNSLLYTSFQYFGTDLSLQGKIQFNTIILQRFFQLYSQNQRISFGTFSLLIFCTIDKKSWQSLQMMFELCDLDGDGILSYDDLYELYQDIENIKNENQIIFTQENRFDVYYQQLLEIAEFNTLTLKNIKNSGFQNVFFNFVMSLQKLIEFEIKSNSFQNEQSFEEWCNMMYDFMDQGEDDQIELDGNALID